MFVTAMINENLSPECFENLKTYKKSLKALLLVKQNSGSVDNWNNDNFPLYNIIDLRKSCSQKERVSYTHFFE